MAGCGDAGCSCVIKAGSGVSVSGSGSSSNPFVIDAENALFDSFSVRDTDSVNLTLTGLGTPDNRFVLSADATLKLTALADVMVAVAISVAASAITNRGPPRW